MKVVGRLSRILIGLAGLVLAYMAIVGVMEVWQTNPWADLGALEAFFSRSMVVAIPAVPIGLVLAALRPSLWPLSLAALIWAVTATVLVEPREFDFAIEWLLRFSSSS